MDTIKIEKAREIYMTRLLNEQFENTHENKLRKEKLDKLSDIIFLNDLHNKTKK